MEFDLLFRAVEQFDEELTSLFEGAPLLLALGIALLLGLRHATDPDHLVAVTSLIASQRSEAAAAQLGAWWGLGHAAMLLGLGLPLIALKSDLPEWLEVGAEKTVGVVIVVLGARVIWKWARGDYRAGRHPHEEGSHGHLRRGEGTHGHLTIRTPHQAFGIGVLHGLAGTGAVVVLLIAAMPGQLEAAAALAVFAPMTVVSMVACTSALAWILTRPLVEPVYRTVLIPALSTFTLAFGLWYAGIT